MVASMTSLFGALKELCVSPRAAQAAHLDLGELERLFQQALEEDEFEVRLGSGLGMGFERLSLLTLPIEFTHVLKLHGRHRNHMSAHLHGCAQHACMCML